MRRRNRHTYSKTHYLYIRVYSPEMASVRQFHEDHLRKLDGNRKLLSSSSQPKVLMLDPETIKFGITCNLDYRNGTYRNDDGAFLYVFGFDNEEEAVAIESHFRRAFKHATIGKTKEYVNVAKMAPRYLHNGSCDAKSVARCMFGEVLAKIHDIFPKYRDNFGSFFYAYLQIRTKSASPPPPEDDVIRSPHFMEVDEIFQETTRELNTMEYTLTPQHFSAGAPPVPLI